jgi:molecular chaperone DnaK
MGLFKPEEPKHVPNLPLTLNLEVADGKVIPIIKAGTPLPAEWSEEFQTGSKSFDDITLQLLVGESGEVSKNQRIGSVKVMGVPPGSDASTMVRVVIRIDMYGRITAEARVGGQELSVKTALKHPSAYLAEGPVAKIRARSTERTS